METIAEPILGSPLLEWVASYGYWIVIPLMIIEGPIVTIIAAVLASFGVFNPFTVFGLSVAGDLTSDVAWYLLGRRGTNFLRRFSITRKLLEHATGQTGRYQHLRKLFLEHGMKTIFVTKIFPGATVPTDIAAGVYHMNFKKFFIATFWGGIVYSALLVAIGFFLGHSVKNLGRLIGVAVVGGLAFILVLVVLYFYFGRKSVDSKVGHLMGLDEKNDE